MTADEAIPTYIRLGLLYRWSVAQYFRMSELGVLTEYERVELLEGHLVKRRTATPLYSNTVTQCIYAFRTFLPDDRRLRPGQPVILTDSVPEPDIAVVTDRGAGSVKVLSVRA